MAANDCVIVLHDVTKVFQRHNGRDAFVAVDRLSFAIKRGEIVAVLGKTGCGRSTVFNLISGLIEPSSGTVHVLGHDSFREFTFFRGKIGNVFQNDRLMPWRTAIENVLLGFKFSTPSRGGRARSRAAGLCGSDLPVMKTTIPTRSPVGCVSAFPLRVPLPLILRFSCVTNRSRRSTR
jgi:ABC-type nitrate/sulfonate/bicarbonate transport system ATPase subunit